jgi:hypothetical protein
MEHPQGRQYRPAGGAVLQSRRSEQGQELDHADSNHKIRYALTATGSGGWPSVARVKSVGAYFHAEMSIPKSRMTAYKNAGIKVFLFTGKNESDYAKMAALEPYGMVVNDVQRFQIWRNSQI